MKLYLRRPAQLSVAVALAVFGLLAQPRESAAAASAEIRRTSFGVPHILASDERGLGYGIGYA